MSESEEMIGDVHPLKSVIVSLLVYATSGDTDHYVGAIAAMQAIGVYGQELILQNSTTSQAAFDDIVGGIFDFLTEHGEGGVADDDMPAINMPAGEA